MVKLFFLFGRYCGIEVVLRLFIVWKLWFVFFVAMIRFLIVFFKFYYVMGSFRKRRREKLGEKKLKDD